MRLKNVAKSFDKTVCKDVYSNYTFKGQLEPIQFYTVDGAKVKRRLLSTAPGVNIPARRTFKIKDQVYIIGDGTADEWNNESIRMNYVLMGADFIAQIKTVPQLLADFAGFEVYASRDWSKSQTDSRDSAEFFSQYSIFLPLGEPVEAGNVVMLDNKYYLVKEARRSISGFVDAMSNELVGPVLETIDYGTRTYNPVTDTYTSAPSSVRVMRVRWQEAFRYLTRASTDYERGDEILFMLKAGSPNPKTADLVPLSDGSFRVIAFLDEGAYWSLHVRRA